MLTGDNERKPRAMAEQGGVAIPGDDTNDGPALATATVGIAMGAPGTDTSPGPADVSLIGDNLSKLSHPRALAGQANGVTGNATTPLRVAA